MAQLVARLSGGQEVVSSSLATPTIKEQNYLLFYFIKKGFPLRQESPFKFNSVLVVLFSSKKFFHKRGKIPALFLFLNGILFFYRLNFFFIIIFI